MFVIPLVGTEHMFVVVDPEVTIVVPVVPGGQFHDAGGVARGSMVTVVVVPPWPIVYTCAEAPLGTSGTVASPWTYMPPPVRTFGPLELLYGKNTPEDAPPT